MKTLVAILTGMAAGTLAALWMATRRVVEPGGIEVASGGSGPSGTSAGADADEGTPNDE